MFAIVICLVLFLCTLTIWSTVLCVLIANVMLSLMNVMSPPPTLGVCFRGELGFLNCDDICMCVVNKQFELLEFVFDSVYVDLQYDEISLTFSTGSVSVLVLCL